MPDQPMPRLCESCNEPIGAERLEALPNATTCFACANLRRRFPPPVLHWWHVFDHRSDAHAHGFHVLRRHAVLLLRLTPARTSPDAL